MDAYEYAYRLGFSDGRTAQNWMLCGKEVNHGDLLSANDAYSIGYRAGLQG